MNLYIGDIVENTVVEGPFDRFALWVSGCSIQCIDCCNEHLFKKSSGKKINIKDLSDLITKSQEKNKIEGISLLGGEPLDQAEELYQLLSLLKSRNLGIMLYSGYYLEQINKKASQKKVLKFVDLLVDGPYLPEQRDMTRRWIGSKNQNMHFLSNRYNKNSKEFTKRNQVELVLKKSSLEAHGYPVLNLKKVK